MEASGRLRLAGGLRSPAQQTKGERDFHMTSKVRGRMGSKKGLANMSLPADERHRKRKAKGKRKSAIAQMNHGKKDN